MTLESRLGILLALVLVAGALGLIWRARSGKEKKVSNGEVINLTELGAFKNGKPVSKFGSKVTFLQFSSEFCSACAQTSRLYSELEKVHPEILHLEIDITNRLDLANKFNILQTPTTLVLDSAGRITSRIGGAAKQQEIQDRIGSFEI